MHIPNVVGIGTAHVGKMDAILADSHLDTWFYMHYAECDCAKARICRRRVGRERKLRDTAVNSTDDSS